MNKSTFINIFKFFALLMVLLAIFGGVRKYSPIPFGDMWEGTLNFHIKLMNGNDPVWWIQHNEHRILLSRILFWIDYKFFEGQSIFLITINYVFAGLASLVFIKFSNLVASQYLQRSDLRVIAFFLISMMFFWSQNNNFTWAFQSQFFLAQLLPLSAFLFLALDKFYAHRLDFFITACLLGIFAAGSMANGIIAFPLMLIYSLLIRNDIRKSLTLVFLMLFP